jgi:hypothetical protein
MRIFQQDYEHPTQASRARLNVYRYQPAAEERVSGMLPRQDGFLLTEERVGTTTVVSTLGFYPVEAEARARMQTRAAELARQGWRAATTPGPVPSVPPGALVASEPPPPE